MIGSLINFKLKNNYKHKTFVVGGSLVIVIISLIDLCLNHEIRSKHNCLKIEISKFHRSYTNQSFDSWNRELIIKFPETIRDWKRLDVQDSVGMFYFRSQDSMSMRLSRILFKWIAEEQMLKYKHQLRNVIASLVDPCNLFSLFCYAFILDWILE